MSWLRDIDRWFLAHVLPYEPEYLRRAQRLLGNAEDARDLVQEAYARVLSHESWRQLENPGGYVSRIVRNLAVERIRRARVVTLHQVANLEALDHAITSPDTLSQIASDDAVRHLIQAIEKLPAQCRRVVVMRKIHDLPPREIARQLGIALSTVEKHLARALVLLACSVGAEGPAHGGVVESGRPPLDRRVRD